MIVVAAGLVVFSFYREMVEDGTIGALFIVGYTEARGEGDRGIDLVHEVVDNRKNNKEDFPDSVVEVVFEKKNGVHQFEGVKNPIDFEGEDVPSVYWAAVKAAFAYRFLPKERLPNATRGAVLYYSPTLQKELKRSKPCWAVKKYRTLTYKGHEFFRKMPWPEMKRRCRTKVASK